METRARADGNYCFLYTGLQSLTNGIIAGEGNRKQVCLAELLYTVQRSPLGSEKELSENNVDSISDLNSDDAVLRSVAPSVDQSVFVKHVRRNVGTVTSHVYWYSC